MLTYGTREANEHERLATIDLVSHFSDRPETLRFPEISVVSTDSYGREMVFIRVLQEDGYEEALLVAFQQLAGDGGYLASPKAILRVRESSFYTGVEHHKVRNNWECPPDATPIASLKMQD